MLMSADDRRIEQQSSQVGNLDGLKYPRPHTRLRPAIEQLEDRVPIAKALGKVSPGCTGSGHPNHCVYKQSIVFAVRTGISLFAGEKRFDQTPLLVRDFVATHGLASLPGPGTSEFDASVYPTPSNSANRNVNMT